MLRFGQHQKELFGHAARTTNQRMELSAAICALATLKRPVKVTIFSDSAYLVDGMSKGWLERWKKTGWMNSGKRPVANKDLWLLLSRHSTTHEITWVKVKGHDEDPGNNQADALAWIAARSQSEEWCVHSYPNRVSPTDCKRCAQYLEESHAKQESLDL